MGHIPIKIQGQDTWLHDRLKEKLDRIPKIINKNWDCCFIVSGKERSGKSTLALLCGAYLSQQLDTPFTIDNIAVDSTDAKKKLQTLPDKSVLVIDEGALVFSSRDSMTKEQKELIKILTVIGQKNSILIVVLPSFFMLSSYLALNRSSFLLHVYTTKKLQRGNFVYFGERRKQKLYDKGKKFNSMNIVKANYKGEYPNIDLFGQEYREIKKDSLLSSFNNLSKNDKRYLEMYNNLKQRTVKNLYERGYSQKRIAEILGVSDKTIEEIPKNPKKSILPPTLTAQL